MITWVFNQKLWGEKMSYRKSDKFFLNVIAAILAVSFFNNAQAAEDKWEYMGRTDSGNFLLYMDNQGVSYMPEDVIRLRVKKELSKEGVELLRKSFEESVKTVRESGVKTEDLEDLFKASVKGQTREFTVDIFCNKNEIWTHPPAAYSINFITSDPILPGTTEEKLKNRLCKDRS